MRMPRPGNPSSAVGEVGPTSPPGDARAPGWPRSRSLGVLRCPAGHHQLAALLWLCLWARGSRRASRVAFPGPGSRVPRGSGSPPGRLGFLGAGLGPVRFLCSIILSPTPHPNKPTLRKRWVAAKALSWPLPSWRFSTSREGGLYHQPRFRQEPFHPNLCISVRSGPETWSRRQACIDCPACPLRCDIFLLRLSSGHPGWGVRRC